MIPLALLGWPTTRYPTVGAYWRKRENTRRARERAVPPSQENRCTAEIFEALEAGSPVQIL
jgi:hypothetical protein